MSISPDQFLAQPSDPDEEETPDWRTEGSPLASIAWSLSDISALLEGFVRGPAKQEHAAAEQAPINEAAQLVVESLADLEAKYESLFGLLADVEKLVSKSTSKLANSVRDAITAWKTGTVVEESLSPEPPEQMADWEQKILDEAAGDAHNHAWDAGGEGQTACACGAWIDYSDQTFPQGIVREPSDG